MVDSTLISTLISIFVTFLAAFFILSIPFTICVILRTFRLRKAARNGRYPAARVRDHLAHGGRTPESIYGAALAGLSSPTSAPRAYFVNLPMAIRAPPPAFRNTGRLDPQHRVSYGERAAPLGAMFLALGHNNAPPLSARALNGDV